MRTDRDWNLLVTAREGRQRELRSALAHVVALRRTRFRNVLVGWVDDFETVAAAIEAQRERQPFLDQCLARVLPIERTFRVEVDGLADVLKREVAPLVDRLAGRSFHVRVERRGHKDEINSHLVEQQLGEHLRSVLEPLGETPVVAFSDPDVVLSVELLGDVGGVGLITRELHGRYPFVRID